MGQVVVSGWKQMVVGNERRGDRRAVGVKEREVPGKDWEQGG